MANMKNKHNAELKQTDPGTKVTGEFSTRGLFSHLMLEIDFYYCHRFRLHEKYTRNIGHMPWLYQSIKQFLCPNFMVLGVKMADIFEKNTKNTI